MQRRASLPQTRYQWAESCEAFISFHDEEGLIAIGGSTEEVCKKIDAVTKEDLRDLVRKALGSDGKRNAPTLGVVGDRVDYVPSHEEVKSWFEL